MAKRPNRSRGSSKNQSRQWRRMDLHLHTPGSSDYQQPEVSYLDILRQAELRGLDIIAFTDHNTVSGFAAMKEEIKQLLMLEELGRSQGDEKRRLDEYRRLLEKMLVLPGFEFTATFGFHILGIFPAETPVSYLEHLLLTLRVPLERLQEGSVTVGATSDVLTAYQIISGAGGIVIAAHANSGNGVVMRGLDFGGQTRIAYTQDPNLHVLEVTDLEKRGRYTTRRFFDGSKPEYPRAMRCIQGSDAHRLVRESEYAKTLGVGDRVTEILLTEMSFDALAEVLKGNDFALTRPFRGKAAPVDFVQMAREEGASLVQSFHTGMTQRGGHLHRILEDICAMANTNGGVIYAGASANPQDKPTGVAQPHKAIERLMAYVSDRFTPVPEIEVDSLLSQGRNVVRITVQPGSEPPYAIDENKFYVRDEAETTLAVRDELVRLVERSLQGEVSDRFVAPAPPPGEVLQPSEQKPYDSESVEPPRTGVEIVASEKRKGTIYHTVRDLRNGNLIKNVTRSSARKLWHYAITQTESGLPDEKEIDWHGNIAIINERKKDQYVWYDLAMRENGGDIRFYYGVTDSGMNELWMKLVEQSQQ